DGPTSEQLIGGAIVFRHTQITASVNNGRSGRRICRRDPLQSAIPDDRDRRCYNSRNSETRDAKGSHDSVPSDRGDERVRSLAVQLVQQGIELGPHLVLFGVCDVAKRAFLLRLYFRHRGLWLMMIEVEVTPSIGVGETLGVFHRHVGAVKGSGKVAPARRL